MNSFEVYGKEAENILITQVNQQQQIISEKLEYYSSGNFFFKLHRLVKTIEEFINIFTFGLEKDDTFDSFVSMELNIYNKFFLGLNPIWKRIEYKYGQGTCNRLINLVKYSIDINNSFKMLGWNNFENQNNLESVIGMINYFQSRRRYFISLLYSIDTLKKGLISIPENELVLELIPIIECHCLPLTSIQNKQVFQKLNKNFKLIVDGIRCTSNYHYNILDESYLEPERISLSEHLEHRETNYEEDPFYVDDSKIFSVNEFKNSIIKMEKFHQFYVTDISEFLIFKRIIFELLEHIYDEYFIFVDEDIFINIVKKNSDKNSSKILESLISNSNDYNISINSYQPVIKIESGYTTNINLLMRFMYFYKNKILNKKRRFQIHSGFIFEDEVKNKLKENGFFVTENTKRIERKEFDIVAIRNNTIYNFQCKNSFIDISLIYASPEKFIRKSKHLQNYFNRALRKEVERESLLKVKLKIEDIKHYVISRYPIVSENENIISFFDLHDWIKKNFKDEI
ncbi:MAG: hypothetical protein C0626_07270 [Arcobacter sp.]|nr:MAG: hypothetical protein C0626_07270 [Arcobacter sp.]